MIDGFHSLSGLKILPQQQPVKVVDQAKSIQYKSFFLGSKKNDLRVFEPSHRVAAQDIAIPSAELLADLKVLRNSETEEQQKRLSKSCKTSKSQRYTRSDEFWGSI
ncbi:hypothetical protein HELRODRAFT_182615 [Helobdella robusta]|uniref:Uncharacterized protein n=1 Tax=Helobdella robusta TaxID=6412 RepID=T1FIH4_HELRO|nr:hypothetical protein HELRODRAFT_182615 [Helobdella robusta]ESN90788.1 hypothetical protein HELRODRAFT_182615 [Helobdella robusta]